MIIMKIMKIIKLHMKIMKNIKIIEVHAIITKIMKIVKIRTDNYGTHDNNRISFENHKKS